MGQKFIIKSSFKSRAGYNRACTVHIHVLWYVFQLMIWFVLDCNYVLQQHLSALLGPKFGIERVEVLWRTLVLVDKYCQIMKIDGITIETKFNMIKNATSKNISSHCAYIPYFNFSATLATHMQSQNVK